MQQLDGVTNPNVYRAAKVAAYGLAGAIAIAGCSSGSGGASPLGKNCHPLGMFIDASLKKQIEAHHAPDDFTKPLRDPQLKVIDFGIPATASAAEAADDQKVIAAIHGLVGHHLIHVIQGKTASVPEGSLGVTVFSGDCPTMLPSPTEKA